MNLYTLALFLHVSGAIGAFISLGVWLFGLSALRRARRVEQVRALAWLMILVDPLMVVSVLLIGLAGFHMALSTWGLQTSWIAVAFASFVLMAPLGPFVLSARMHTIRKMAGEAPDGTFPDVLFKRIHDPILPVTASTLVSMLLGIVFLMTTKPSLLASILVMGLALLPGLILSLPPCLLTSRRDSAGSGDGNNAEIDPFLKKTLWTRRW